MLFFFIVASVAILLFVAMLTRDGFAVWMAFCFELWAWGTGLIIFVLHHFISKYW